MKKNLAGACLLTMTCLYGLLAAIVIAVFMIIGAGALPAIILSIIILLFQYLVSPFFTDLSMKWIYKAKFDKDLPDYLKIFITDTCKKYNMKFPKIGFIDDGAPNAFTYGRTKNDARIILTRGIFDLLSEEEVKAVVGHELGHATHYDMLFMTMAQLVPLVLYGIYEIFTSADKNDDDASKLAAIGYIAYIFYVISQFIVLYLSRKREYYADAFALEETKNPTALAESLVKIGFGLSTSSDKNSKAMKSNALGIFDSKTSKSLVISASGEKEVSKEKIQKAMRWEKWNLWAVYYEINSTHPLISKRLEAISSRCEEFNQKPYIEFKEEKTESYVDDFFIELLILLLPIISLVLTVVLALTLENKLIWPIGIFLVLLASFYQFTRSHKNKNYNERTIEDLLGEVKVSSVTSIPCTLTGNIIGRGNPGCIFNEDFILKDDTGIIFLDYNQPMNLLNKIFAIFKSKEYFDKKVTIKGWYRRSPVPYVEIYKMEVDGKTKKIYTYPLSKTIYLILLIVCIVTTVLMIA